MSPTQNSRPPQVLVTSVHGPITWPQPCAAPLSTAGGEEGCSCRSCLCRICLLCVFGWSSPKAGLSTEPDRGEDEGGGQTVNPLHEGHAGRAQVGLAAWGWLCPAVWGCSSTGQASGVRRGEMNHRGPTSSSWSPWSGCAGQGHCGSWIVSAHCHRRVSMGTRPQGQQHRRWQLHEASLWHDRQPCLRHGTGGL